MIMHFRIQRWERYVGIFILLAVVILISSLVFMARGQKWFEERHRYLAVFAKVQGVKPGTPVTISGLEVGSVHSLGLTAEGKVEIRLDILDSYKDFIRADSEVTIATALLGGKTVEISRGSPDRPAAGERQVLRSQESRELADLLRELDLQAPLKKVDETLENLKSLTARLGSPEGELFTTLRNVEFISAQLKEGKGTAGALLKDPKLYREAEAALESAKRAAAGLEEVAARAVEASRELPAMAQQLDGRIREIGGILEDVKKTTAKLPPILENANRASAEAPAIAGNIKDITDDVRAIAGDVKKATPAIPGLVNQTQETVEDAEQILAGLRNHWLIRGWVAAPRRDGPIEIGQRQDPYEKRGDPPR